MYNPKIIKEIAIIGEDKNTSITTISEGHKGKFREFSSTIFYGDTMFIRIKYFSHLLIGYNLYGEY